MLNEWSPVAPGWFAMLVGHEADLLEWQQALRPPFDPWCEQVRRGSKVVWALRSLTFEEAESASEVRDRALPLIERLNGAFAISANTERVTFHAVGRATANAEVHLDIFVEATARVRLRGLSAVAVAEVRDASGNLIPAPPPQPSTAQNWIQAAELDDGIGDMLVFAGRADNWFDVYKALELAERVTGKRQRLYELLGPTARSVRNMRETANFYRHAPAYYRPSVLTTKDEAAVLLGQVVRTVLAHRRTEVEHARAHSG